MKNASINRFLQSIENELKGELPGNESHVQMMPYLRIGAAEARETQNPRFCAVMLLLFDKNDELQILLIKRTENGGTHSGQIAFPGGKMDPADESLLHTALRETHEEIGIPHSHIQLLGQLSEVYIPPSNFLAQPYVGYLPKYPELTLQTNEVQYVIHFPLRSLLDEKFQHTKPIFLPNYKLTLDVPCFELEQHTIWGATALMLNEFKWICERLPAGHIPGLDL